MIQNTTDWATRANKYNNLQWVNNNITLWTMVNFAKTKETVQNILDLGTGTGKVLEYFRHNYQDSNLFGIDLSQDMLDKIDPTINVKTFNRNCEDLKCFKDGEMDIVTARMSLHHVDELKKCLDEVYRVLSPGGSFIICEGVPPNSECFSFYEEVFRYKEKRHTFLSDNLTDLLHRTGFKKMDNSTVYTENMSINNWLENADLSQETIDIIKNMHRDCSDNIKDAYCMNDTGEDIFMDWKFIIINAVK